MTPSGPSGRFRLGIDTGGTFTDFVVISPSGLHLYKTPSTPDDPTVAIEEGLRLISADLKCSAVEFLRDCELIILGTTVAVNALIEHKGVTTGLFCTKGHEDSLEIRLGHKEDGHRYDADFPPAQVLVPRALRVPVTERVLSTGEVRVPLNEDDVRRGLQLFREHGVQAIAVSFLWSFLYPRHELRVREIIREEWPEVYLTLSVDLLPQIREYTRTSTAVVNAYVGPIIKTYVERVESFLHRLGYRGAVRYMQSNGGLTFGRFLMDKGIYALNSGPAAGPNAGLFFGDQFGTHDVITIDMGGTSFDLSLCRAGRINVAKDFDFMRYRVGVPMLEVETLGAGGGSIAFVNPMGLLQVGPESAGAQPGPAAYGRGGNRATVTDALVVLGYLNPKGLLGGRLPLDADGARSAIARDVAGPLGLTVEQAALGIFRVVNANMVSGIRRVSIEKGHDPRDFVLVVGGGAGSAHAGVLASELGVRTVLIPKAASAFCAFGAIFSDLKHSYTSSHVSRLDDVDPARINAAFREMEQRGRSALMEAGIAEEQMAIHRTMDMRYVDQIHECQVDVPAVEFTAEGIRDLAEPFHRRHEQFFTYCEPDNAVEVINLEATVVGRLPRPRLPALVQGNPDPSDARSGDRRVLFVEYGEFMPAPVFDGARLRAGNIVEGPGIIEEETTTIVVFPGWTARLDAQGTYVMTSAA